MEISDKNFLFGTIHMHFFVCKIACTPPPQKEEGNKNHPTTAIAAGKGKAYGTHGHFDTSRGKAMEPWHER